MPGRSKRKRMRRRAMANAAAERGEGGDLSTHADARLVGGLLRRRDWVIPDRAFTTVPRAMNAIVEQSPETRARIQAASVLVRMGAANVQAEKIGFTLDVLASRVDRPLEPTGPAATSQTDAAEPVGQPLGDAPIEIAFLARNSLDDMRAAMRELYASVPSLFLDDDLDEERSINE